jgi:CheY-like chemotaxis protein
MRQLLVIEDEPDLRDNLTEVLRNGGYAVVAVPAASEGMSLLRRGLRPDAIILDLLMPEMDGWDFRKAQLADPALSAIPVVVISAVVGYSLPIAPVMLAKPINVPLLLRELAACTGATQAESPPS